MECFGGRGELKTILFCNYNHVNCYEIMTFLEAFVNKMDWPRDNREELEIDGFINLFKKPPISREFRIIEDRTKQQGPDYFVEDVKTKEHFGIELTSVYSSDRSVPNEHMNSIKSGIHDNSVEIERYKKRIIEQVLIKISKAKKGYDLRYPLILSVYINEFISIHIDRNEFQLFLEDNEATFDSIDPFSGVFFWPIGSGNCAKPDFVLVTPNKKI